MNTLIQMKNLKKSYPNGVEALKGIDLKINKDQIFSLLGPNGAGKSTLIKILCTLLKRDSGDLLIHDMDPETHRSEIQHLIGVASQENELDPTESVLQLLIFQALLFDIPIKRAKQRAEELIEVFQLKSEYHKKTKTLSGGNKRKLHCALALVHQPKILILDEPTVGMDPIIRASFWETIKRLNENEQLSVFLTTQYLEEADKFTSQMALLFNGLIDFSGSVSEFKQMVHPDEHLSLEDSYLLYIRNKMRQLNEEKGEIYV